MIIMHQLAYPDSMAVSTC